jgi:drug/metabolite transporter (DMT)-like permease
MGRFSQAFLLATLAAAGYGSVGIFIHFLSAQGLSPSAMLMGRYMFMTLLLLPFVLQAWRKSRRFERDSSINESQAFQPSTLKKIIGLGVIGTTVQAGCYILAVKELGPGTAAILIYIYPSLVLLWERILFGHPIRLEQVGLMALSWSGSYLVLGFHSFHGTWLGAMAAILSAIFYSFYLSSSHHVSRGCNVWITSWCVALGALIGTTFTWIFLDRTFPSISFSLFATLFGYAVVGTIIPMAAVFAAMRLIGAASTSLLCMSEPIFAVLVGVWLFQESLSPVQIAGAFLIMTASILLSLEKSNSGSYVTA